MSVNQKLELSREIRQWIGMAIGAGSTFIVAWYFISPESFNKVINKIKRKIEARNED